MVTYVIFIVLATEQLLNSKNRRESFSTISQILTGNRNRRYFQIATAN